LVRILDVDAATRQEAWEIFVKYADKDLSFTDCTSVAIMRQGAIANAFTFDEHFRQLGFVMIP